MKSRVLRTVAVLGILALVAGACSRKSNNGSTSSSSKTVKIGVIAPLTGPLSPLGLGIKNAVDLAVTQANKAQKIKGYRIVLDAEDDGADAATGANAANKLASDPSVAAVVGTLNSSVAQQVAPVLQRAHISEISPANTNPTLSRGQDPIKSPKRVWDNYFRVATTDSVQGPFAADYAFKQAGYKSVATVHDKKTYGQGLVAAFAAQFQKEGGKITSQNTINPGDRDFGALVTKLVGEKPDMVYYGGEFPEAGPLAAQLKSRGFKGPLMGGDGIYDPAFISGAGGASKAEGSLATSVGAPTNKLASAKTFVSDYSAAGYKDSYSAYGAFSYDAANILIDALAKVLPNASSVESARPDIITAVGQTQNYQGVTGTTTFDQYGDTSNKVLTVYRVTGGAWKDVFTGTFTG